MTETLPTASFGSYQEYAQCFPSMETRHIQRFFDTLSEKNNHTSCGLVVNTAKSLMKWHEIVRHEDEALDHLIGDAENRRETLKHLSERLNVFQRFVDSLPTNVFQEDEKGPNFDQPFDFLLLERFPRNMDYEWSEKDDEQFCELHDPQNEDVTKASSATYLARNNSLMTSSIGAQQSEQSLRTASVQASPGISAASVTTFSLQHHLPQLLRERDPRDGGHHHFPLMNTNVAPAGRSTEGNTGWRLGGRVLNRSSSESTSDSSYTATSSDQESTPSSSMSTSSSASSSSSSGSSSRSTTGSTTTSNNPASELLRNSAPSSVSSPFSTTHTAQTPSAGHTPTHPATTTTARPTDGSTARRQRRVRLRAAVAPMAPWSGAVSAGAHSSQTSLRERRAARLTLEPTSPRAM